MEKYKDFTREDLIQLLVDLEGKRAFTYEDQLKLVILDKSPFTIWASDRNYIIKMWEGQCESMYGRKKEDVLGKDFVDLFVATDEQAAARRDQMEIIDNGKEFHNIANDQARNGNTLQLITNCFRIQDPITGEYWNAEMGVAIDYYEEEKKQLARNIEEGRLIQALISDFSQTQNQYREQFDNRKELVLATIRTGKFEAAKQQKADVYLQQTQTIEQRIQQIDTKVYSAIDEYSKKIKQCTSSAACATIKHSFISVVRKILNEFDDIVVDLEIMCYEITNQSSDVSIKNKMMKVASSTIARLQTLADQMWLKAEDAINEYMTLGTQISSNSTRLKYLKQQRDEVLELKTAIHTIGDEIYSKIIVDTSDDSINDIKQAMVEKYSEIETKLEEIKRGLGC